MKLKALHNRIIASEIERGEQKSRGGIVLLDDDAKEQGIRPRWMQVYAVGPDVRDIVVGQWILTEHGRWTHGMSLRDGDNEITLWGVEEEAVLLVSDERPVAERAPKVRS